MSLMALCSAAQPGQGRIANAGSGAAGPAVVQHHKAVGVEYVPCLQRTEKEYVPVRTDTYR
ncbi:uncharacterized protein LY79DRAFT_544936 [Colletotrichum navitas]|uniref:Uncharacterized protein n=1 Tax=Colletotrichum navitas TaxID=681940 RepID=A0AAD8Q4Z9_9PEZI|nr:uncharacterized protein LY79DRAFT_544936 [Colletotrichum navitas]KAK1595973.1 hypothetical protein LY79DRAFT_544936 [Colletotrichum navitas]